MERDFMGLGSKNKSVVTVKEEIPDGITDSAPYRASAMQWPFSNKVSAVPQLLSFKNTQDDGPRKTGFDSLTSTGYMTVSSAEAFMQRKSTPAKQPGTNYAVTTYPQQFDSYPCPREVKTLSVANQTNQNISVTMSTPTQQPFLASAGQHVTRSSANPQPLGIVPVMSPAPIVPRSTSIVGSTDLRNASKPTRGPAQLTIFYDGSVCVYNDISPEKAQAIMLLAGNGNSTNINKPVHSTQVEAPVPRPRAVDGFIQSHITFPCPGGIRLTLIPISETSCAASQPVGVSSGSANVTAATAIGTLASTSNKSEPSKVVSNVIPSAVPQARKASLARFLEKRKERVTSASPYGSKQSPECSTPGSDSRSFSVNTSGSYPLPAVN